MHSTGDYKATQSFNAEFWGQHTVIFMDYITKDLVKGHWDGIFRGLSAVSMRVTDEIAVMSGAPPVLQECVPLLPLDLPSLPAEA